MKNTTAFTLVELSIVLVILGLLIGGVLTGQSLIRAAELRSVSTQQARYVTAVQTFRDKYFALPGDMTNATSYWGIAAGSTGNDAACKAASSTTAVTCNGNGDGQLTTTATGSNEIYRFWQHLANAGLIEGSYDGVQHGSTSYSTTAANAPLGRISGSLWHVYNWGGPASNSAYVFDGVYDNFLEFGAITANMDPKNPIFKPEDAYNLDTKTDDGKPATGKVVMEVPATANFPSCTDSSATTAMNANYLLTNTAIACSLIFRQQF